MEIDSYIITRRVQMSNNQRWETSLMACSLYALYSRFRLDDKAPCLTGQIQIGKTQDIVWSTGWGRA